DLGSRFPRHRATSPQNSLRDCRRDARSRRQDHRPLGRGKSFLADAATRRLKLLIQLSETKMKGQNEYRKIKWKGCIHYWRQSRSRFGDRARAWEDRDRWSGRGAWFHKG